LTASVIAAEIDALTAQLAAFQSIEADMTAAYGRAREAEAQLAEARAQHQFCGLFLDSANADLRECQSALRLALAGTEQNYFATPARIDDVRAALAEARAQRDEAYTVLQKRTAERDECRAAVHGMFGVDFDAAREVGK
jgi:hypothetical protein